MKMILHYKKVLKPLYPADKGEEIRDINYPAELRFFSDGTVYEVDNVHCHNWYICETAQIISIEIQK